MLAGQGSTRYRGALFVMAALLGSCAGKETPNGSPPPTEVALAPAPSAAAAPRAKPDEPRPEEAAQTPPTKPPIAAAPGCATKPPPVDRKDLLGLPLASGNPNIMGPYFGQGFGFHRVNGAAPPPREQADAPLELVLSGPATLAPGKPLSLKLSFVNHDSKPLVVMRPLDGSLEQWRYPYYDLYLRDEQSGVVYRWAFTGGRCGNVNTIRAEDYVELSPGKPRGDVVNGWAQYLSDAPIPKAGTYAVWVVYSFCGFEGDGLPLGKNEERPNTYLGSHASNAVRVVVR